MIRLVLDQTSSENQNIKVAWKLFLKIRNGHNFSKKDESEYSKHTNGMLTLQNFQIYFILRNMIVLSSQKTSRDLVFFEKITGSAGLV